MREGGRVYLCALEDVSQPGLMPVEKLVAKARPFFSKRTVSTVRMALADGADRQWNLIIRCWNISEEPADATYAVMPDGNQYHVEYNHVVDEDAIDAILTRLEDYYEVDASSLERFV